ncbi:hypothetical protein [Arenibaculum sp.]|jgi:hypothetical protein|uniref:hypothetical protein n=1 Tax=Arenibaculum sp. TaxID=2865862 RepID=UPI002E0D490C|nr:hypothetical protein [Arenibaculum sp.]
MSVLSNPYVLGYHGCKKDIGEAILAGTKPHLRHSDNPWDWLGRGIYFWEADPVRGYEWAKDYCARNGGEPFVIGAVIHLGNCLNLMDRASLNTLKAAYDTFSTFHDRAFPDKPLPVNKPKSKRHDLDCAVINHLHKLLADNIDDEGNPAPLPPFNTVRGLYQEDDPIFADSMIKERTHIQIAVLTAEQSIQGYFRVPEEHYN